jgi:hypothetical protein
MLQKQKGLIDCLTLSEFSLHEDIIGPFIFLVASLQILRIDNDSIVYPLSPFCHSNWPHSTFISYTIGHFLLQAIIVSTATQTP